jgi:hypothetical protein
VVGTYEGHYGDARRPIFWFVIGVWLLFWWFDEPRGWEHFGPGACFFIAVGAFATFLRYRWERKAMLATPAWTTPADAVGNVENGLAVTQFGRPPMLGFNEQILGVNGQILGRDQSD